MRRHKKKNDKINKYKIANKDNDKLLIYAAIKLVDNERNIMEKRNITQGRQFIINENPTDTHKKTKQQSAIEVITWGMHSEQQPTVPSTASHMTVSTYTSETALTLPRTTRTTKQQC